MFTRYCPHVPSATTSLHVRPLRMNAYATLLAWYDHAQECISSLIYGHIRQRKYFDHALLRSV